MGKHTYFVYFDDQGKAVRFEQVLTEERFARIVPDMSVDDVVLLIGRSAPPGPPVGVSVLGSARDQCGRTGAVRPVRRGAAALHRSRLPRVAREGRGGSALASARA